MFCLAHWLIGLCYLISTFLSVLAFCLRCHQQIISRFHPSTSFVVFVWFWSLYIYEGLLYARRCSVLRTPLCQERRSTCWFSSGSQAPLPSASQSRLDSLSLGRAALASPALSQPLSLYSLPVSGHKRPMSSLSDSLPVPFHFTLSCPPNPRLPICFVFASSPTLSPSQQFVLKDAMFLTSSLFFDSILKKYWQELGVTWFLWKPLVLPPTTSWQDMFSTSLLFYF